MNGIKLIVVLLAGFFVSGELFAAVTINGAGASFPAPAYKRWAMEYNRQTGVKVNYQSVGSGAGVKKITAKTVDFGASDKPLKKAELDKAGMIQAPMLIGGVVPIVNLEGISPGELKLTGSVLADIFLGKIKKWDDKRLAALNSGVKLPSNAITVVHRSDGSGTTWIFSNYLSKVSDAWKNGPGEGKALSWPVGLGGQKNAGVAATVKRVKGSIGYVEYAYAKENKLAHAKLKNKEGLFVDPKVESFQAAAANADWDNAPGFYMVLTEQPGKDSWPITGATYILLHKKQKDLSLAKEMLKFFNWGYKDGVKTALNLNYVPIPENVVKKVHKAWKDNLKTMEGKAVY